MGVLPQGALSAEGKDQLGLSPHVQRCRPHHRSIARMYILGGKRPTELSKVMGMSPGQISRIIGSPAFHTEVARLESQLEEEALDHRKDLEAMAARAMENLDEDLDLEPASTRDREVRQRASLEVLGMVGIRKTGGGGINVLINNNTETKAVDDLSIDELRDEVTDLCIGEDGTYS